MGRWQLGQMSADWSALANCLVPATVARRGRAAELEALTAVDRLVVARLEGHFRVLATLRADGRVHLARAGGVTPTATTARVTVAGGVAPATTGVATVIAARRPLGLALGTTAGAPLRLGIATLSVERLLTRRKSKCLATIAAGNRSVAQLAETLSLLAMLHHMAQHEKRNTSQTVSAEQDAGQRLRAQPNEHLCVDIVWVLKL